MYAMGRFPLLALSTLAICAIALTAQSNSNASATTVEVPRLIRINGTLTPAPGADNASKAIDVTFALYAEETGGEPLWQETQKVEIDAAGHYSILLGSTLSEGLPIDLFTSAQAQWLGVERQGETEQPRIMLVSVPFALKAGDAETLGGKPASAYALAPAPGTAAVISATPTAPEGARLGKAHPEDFTGGGVSNFIPLWTSSSGLGDSLIYQSGGNVGIGITTPVALFDVRGSKTNDITIGSVNSNPTGFAIAASNEATSGKSGAILGGASSPQGDGIIGENNATVGDAVGVIGINKSPTGKALEGTAVAKEGSAIGVYGLTGSPDGAGVYGVVAASTGSGYGVYGKVISPDAAGVYGVNADIVGGENASGVYGQVNGELGAAVYGGALSPTGKTVSVLGLNPSPNGIGVVGYNSATSGNAAGVKGQTNSPTGDGGYFVNVATSGNAGSGLRAISFAPSGYGVWGVNTSTSGNGIGTFGTTHSSEGYAVYGYNLATSGQGRGVQGQTKSPDGIGVVGSSTISGGYGTGVFGTTNTGVGVYGLAFANGTGVIGATGVAGQSGVYASNTATTGDANALFAETDSADGVAGYFYNAAGGDLLVGTVKNNGQNVFSVSGDGDGYYAGDLDVNGTLSKNGGAFKIDDPIDPADKFLYHSFVESPDMKNIYDGNVTTDSDGLATVTLPDYFEALNRDFRYQLTVIGQFAQAIVARKISGNHFVIQTSKPNVEVSWQVTGIRQDVWANAHRIPNEVEKPAEFHGLYLHPELYGQGEEKSIGSKIVTPPPREASLASTLRNIRAPEAPPEPK